jgi:immune inhibitor A
VKRTRWLFLLGILLILVFLCFLVVGGCAWFVFTRDQRMQTGPETVSPPQTPMSTADSASYLPDSAEAETASLLAATSLPQRDLIALAHRLRGLSLPISGFPANAPKAYQEGDTTTFWIQGFESGSFFTETATLRYATPHAYWWVQEGYDVPSQALAQSARNFENRTYPTNVQSFGSEWNPGIDGDPHIYIFLGDVPGVGGYFSGPDEYPTQVSPHSNEHEMFYINLGNASPGNAYFDGILAHEDQHMIHWAQDRDEDTWVNEGLSELAGQINGYDVGSTDLSFGASPDTQLNSWPELAEADPHYGASYLFMAYFLERYGQEAVKKLVAEPANGIAGFNAVLQEVDPTGRRFDDQFADWVIANYLDSRPQSESRYQYSDLEVETPSLAAEHSDYPVRSQASVHQYAADYVLLQGQGDLTVEFQGSPLVSLVGNQVHSGKYQWWSNRGDEADSTLTHAFDLTGLQAARLQAWLWYDLEDSFDYAYVEISSDGGETWHFLSNEHTTLTNPNDNSYGPGFTGRSGGGDEAMWVQETFDLSPYAGQQVLVRFEVITDESVNHRGLCLDDIAIPELGYRDDAEADGRGWQAEGWVRVTDRVPQEFLVQLITVGAEAHVERVPLDTSQHGTATVSGLGQGVDRAILVISGVTPVTTEAASYTYQVLQK